tara:strand:+ start:350 stop:1324 length:975 start_codon:yes stop_codon:yes gene_type:complete
MHTSNKDIDINNNDHNLFICSKPLQLLNVLNIVQNSDIKSDSNILFIVEKFDLKKNEITIKDNLEAFFSDIKILAEYEHIPSILDFKVNKMFIDSDFGANRYIIKKISAKSNIVYEEGYGTYRHNYIDSLILKIKYKIKKLSTYIGGCDLTDEIIVYYPDLYIFSHHLINSKKVKHFQLPFIQNLENNCKLYKRMFGFDDSFNELFGNVLVIAETYGFDESNLDYNKVNLNIYNQIILKTHPNNYNKIEYNFGKDIDCKIIDNDIPIEFIIYELFKEGLNVTLLHTGSSSILHLHEHLAQSIDLLSVNDPYKIEYDCLMQYQIK